MGNDNLNHVSNNVSVDILSAASHLRIESTKTSVKSARSHMGPIPYELVLTDRHVNEKKLTSSAVAKRGKTSERSPSVSNIERKSPPVEETASPVVQSAETNLAQPTTSGVTVLKATENEERRNSLSHERTMTPHVAVETIETTTHTESVSTPNNASTKALSRGRLGSKQEDSSAHIRLTSDVRVERSEAVITADALSPSCHDPPSTLPPFLASASQRAEEAFTSVTHVDEVLIAPDSNTTFDENKLSGEDFADKIGTAVSSKRSQRSSRSSRSNSRKVQRSTSKMGTSGQTSAAPPKSVLSAADVTLLPKKTNTDSRPKTPIKSSSNIISATTPSRSTLTIEKASPQQVMMQSLAGNQSIFVPKSSVLREPGVYQTTGSPKKR
eukprot:GDKJ01054878.1.p1 GENE.GDKJ01054878.1~~GDKJ01054878.1.p1  ORF type:complete len:384 (-),score=74.00 GDKJ01054878.1:103-1254(-)